MNWVWSRGVQQPRHGTHESSNQAAGHPHPLRTRELAGLALLLLAAFATRLPWLSAGYGIDPDCSRVITAAQHIARTGEYTSSRGPAYPVHEYMLSAVVGGGPVFTNGLSALFGCAAVLFFALILRRVGVTAYLLWALAFAFVPVIFVNSVCTIDYVPALAFSLASTYCLLSKWPVASGVLLGLAIGTRVTSGAMLLPLAIWGYLENSKDRRVRDALLLVMATLVAGSAAYLPAFLKYGTAFFAFADWTVYPALQSVLLMGTKGVWGYSPGTVIGSLLLLLLVGGFLAFKSSTWRAGKHALIASGLVVVLYTIAFLRAPFEAGYLVPIVPFVLLGIVLLYPPKAQSLVAIALLPAFLLAPGENEVSRPGAIVNDHRIRMQKHELTLRIIDRANQLPPGSVVVVAWELPQLLIYLEARQQVEHPFVYFIEREEQMIEHQRLGHEVYYLEGLDYHNLQAHAVDIVKFGARPLFETDSTHVAGNAS